MAADDPDRIDIPNIKFIFPFALLGGTIAFTLWTFLMRKKPSIKMGVLAGFLTVFLSYPIIGFAIGIVHPDYSSRVFSGIMSGVSLMVIGNFLTFWITYPVGLVCGWIIAKRYIKSAPTICNIFD